MDDVVRYLCTEEVVSALCPCSGDDPVQLLTSILTVLKKAGPVNGRLGQNGTYFNQVNVKCINMLSNILRNVLYFNCPGYCFRIIKEHSHTLLCVAIVMFYFN